MGKKCSICGQKMINMLGSNGSCINKDCENYIPNKHDSNLIPFYSYEDEDYFEENVSISVESDYEEEYDLFLVYSDKKDYISRYEFRQMNHFIEDTLFENHKIAKFNVYLDDDEIEDKDMLFKKYQIINEGRSLESSPQEALKFYYSYLRNRLFKNDYYMYRKIVIFEKDYVKQLEIIKSFFKSGIYCSRYNYLWFLNKLKIISENIPVSDDIIDECLKNFKENAFNILNYESRPMLLAEKIRRNKDELKVITEEEYSLNQFKYELEAEASQLFNNNQLEYALSIYKKMILDYGFKRPKYFNRICAVYHKLNMYDDELKWIYCYFNKVSRYRDHSAFYRRLDDLNIEFNNFFHKRLFFDTNRFYLTKEDFKCNDVESFEMWDYLCLIKEKHFLIEKGLKLEENDVNEAIEYYQSLLNHEFFKNDYYVYKTLVILYDEIGMHDEEIDVIFSFFKSGIYCDRYNYLFFVYHLKKLSQYFVIYDYEIDDHLNYFKEHGFKNKKLQNTPVPLSERLTLNKNTLNIIPEEEFIVQQDLSALKFEAELFEANSMFYSANRKYFLMRDEYKIEDMDLIKWICINFQKANDTENELKIINEFLDKNLRRLFRMDTDWLYERKSILENSKQIPFEEPKLEILYENNRHYLTFEDYGNDLTNTELVDKIRLKYNLKRKGLKLEKESHSLAIEFYKSLLSHELFENDYYVYRRLVLVYEKINEFELVFDTIKSFFKSGIYCNRYQYIWLLHKLADISQVKYISDEEIDDILKSFKENGFKNKHLQNIPVFIAERIYKQFSSISIYSSMSYNRTHKKYELKEEVSQFELNGANEESATQFRNLIDNGCYYSARDYMRLYHMYMRDDDYENALYVINKYLSTNNEFSRSWFENRLKELENFDVK